MAHAKLTNYYMGHGGMYYVEVYASNETTMLHLIVDAGTNPPAANPPKVEDNLNEVVRCVTTRPAPVVVCLTHAHLDHYSHLAKLLDKLAAWMPTAPRTVYLTADRKQIAIAPSSSALNTLIPEQFEILNNFNKNPVFSNLVKRHAASLCILDAQTDGAELLWGSDTEPVSFYRLFTWASNDSDENRNGTLFALRVRRSLIWFTGDLTGANMRWLCEGESQAAKDIKELAETASLVVVTAPHHGSIHTLEEEDFISQNPMLQDKSPLSDQNLAIFFKLLCGSSFAGLCVSADFGDRYGHPDKWVMTALKKFMESGKHSSFVCYRQSLGDYKYISDTKHADAFFSSKETSESTVLTTWGTTDSAMSAMAFFRNLTMEV